MARRAAAAPTRRRMARQPVESASGRTGGVRSPSSVWLCAACRIVCNVPAVRSRSAAGRATPWNARSLRYICVMSRVLCGGVHALQCAWRLQVPFMDSWTFFALLFAVVALPSALLFIGPLGLCGLDPIRDYINGVTEEGSSAPAPMERRRFGEEAALDDVGANYSGNAAGLPLPRASMSEVFMASPVGGVPSALTDTPTHPQAQSTTYFPPPAPMELSPATSQDGTSPPGSPQLPAAPASRSQSSGAYMPAPTGSPPRLVLTGVNGATSTIRPQTLSYGRGAPLTPPPALGQPRHGYSPGQHAAMRGPAEAAKTSILHLKQPSPVRTIAATEACADGDGGAVLGAGLHSGVTHDVASRNAIASQRSTMKPVKTIL